MSNPTAEEVTFDVVLAGPGLLGEPAVTLGPGQSCSYEAVFSPLVPGAAQGCAFQFRFTHCSQRRRSLNARALAT